MTVRGAVKLKQPVHHPGRASVRAIEKTGTTKSIQLLPDVFPSVTDIQV